MSIVLAENSFASLRTVNAPGCWRSDMRSGLVRMAEKNAKSDPNNVVWKETRDATTRLIFLLRGQLRVPATYVPRAGALDFLTTTGPR